MNSLQIAPVYLQWIETQTLGSDQTDVTFSSLNGDADLVYVIHANIIIATSGSDSNLRLRFNGASDDTGVTSAGMWTGGTGPSAAGFAFGFVGQITGTAAAMSCFSEITIAAKTGVKRLSRCALVDYPNSFVLHSSILWDNSATNITSITLHSLEASRLKAGSAFTLYKMPNG